MGTVPAIVGFLVDKDDVVELIGRDFVEADVVHDFAAGGFFADDDQFGVHQAAGGFGFEAEEFANVFGVLMVHFFKDFVGFRARGGTSSRRRRLGPSR